MVKKFRRLAILKLKKINEIKVLFLKDVDLKKVLPSNKISFGEKKYKYFIDYLHNHHKVKPSHIMLPKISGYVQSYDGHTKWMYFLIEDDELLENYSTIWDKVGADMKKNFIASPSIRKNF